jgi:hypothetical protein
MCGPDSDNLSEQEFINPRPIDPDYLVGELCKECGHSNYDGEPRHYKPCVNNTTAKQ